MGLAGRRVLVTRARLDSDELVSQLETWGALVLHCPTIEIVEPASYELLDRAIEDLSRYDWIIFTSKNAVNAFMGRLKSAGKDQTAAMGRKVLAVGSSTAAALERAGLGVTLVPEKFRAEGALSSLRAYYGDDSLLGDCRFLFPRAAQGRELLVVELEKLGARVDLVEAYRTESPAGAREKLLEIFSNQSIDAVVFTSPSTIQNMAEMLSPEPLSAVLQASAVACIGPVTAGAARDCGLEAAICPSESSATALALAIKDFFESRS
jgi:uroporphyrinogen III methyltransferase / synthase